MNVSVILAHPRPGSFNHAIADTVAYFWTMANNMRESEAPRVKF